MLENKTLDYVYDLTIDFEGIEKGKQYDVGSFIFKNNVKQFTYTVEKFMLVIYL